MSAGQRRKYGIAAEDFAVRKAVKEAKKMLKNEPDGPSTSVSNEASSEIRFEAGDVGIDDQEEYYDAVNEFCFNDAEENSLFDMVDQYFNEDREDEDDDCTSDGDDPDCEDSSQSASGEGGSFNENTHGIPTSSGNKSRFSWNLLEEPVYPGARISYLTIFIMLLAIFFKYKLPWEALVEIIQVVNFMTPIPKLASYLGNKQKILRKLSDISACKQFAACGCDNGMRMTENKGELKEVATCKKCKKGSGIGVVFDLGKSVLRYAQHLNIRTSVTVPITWFFDGIAPYRRSCWLLVVRFGGLPMKFVHTIWIGTTHPPRVVLRHFVEQMKFLYNSGVVLANGQVVKLKHHIGICDSPARAMVTMTKQHGGYNACPFCEVTGEQFADKTVYPNKPRGTKYNSRTAASFTANAEEAERSGEPTMGVKGKAVILEIPEFDPTTGIGIDYMHTVCLGIVKYYLTELWFKTTSGNYIHQWRLIDDRYDEFVYLGKADPRKVPKIAIDGKLNFANWSAQDYRTFLLAHGPAVMKDYLNEEQFQNFWDLRCLVFESLKTDVDVAKIRALALKWVRSFETIYGKGAMTFNVHVFGHHVAEIVEKHGPMFKYSAYTWESFLGVATRQIQSPNAIPMQLANRYGALSLIRSWLDSEHIDDVSMNMSSSYGPTIAAQKQFVCWLLESTRSRTPTTAERFSVDGNEALLFGRQSTMLTNDEKFPSNVAMTWPNGAKVRIFNSANFTDPTSNLVLTFSKNMILKKKGDHRFCRVEFFCESADKKHLLMAVTLINAELRLEPFYVMKEDASGGKMYFFDLHDFKKHNLQPCISFQLDGKDTLACGCPNLVELREIN